VIALAWQDGRSWMDADGYEEYLKPELLQGLSKVAGFRGSCHGEWRVQAKTKHTRHKA
jgi:hypothetical protein